MIDNIKELQQIVTQVGISQQKTAELNIPDFESNALAIEVDESNSFEIWKKMRGLVDRTGRWPLIYAGWGNVHNSWEESLVEENPFDRWSFENEQDNNETDYSPTSIVKRAINVTLEAAIKQHSDIYSEDLEDELDYILDETLEKYDGFLDKEQIKSQVKSGEIKGYLSLEKYLLDWEMVNTAKDAAPTIDQIWHMDWFKPKDQTQALLLLPTKNGWESLAYLHWYGSDSVGSETAISALRKWNKLYGAELVAHYGTMLQMTASRSPKDINEAFCLATEQIALAPCTTVLPGVSVRDHARALLVTKKWFLHERP